MPATKEMCIRDSHWDAATRPLSEAQNYSGCNQPTKEMVESYPMITGTPITESPDYDPLHFWQNRDPRFTSTIAYNGCKWELSGKKDRIQWTYQGHSTPVSYTHLDVYKRQTNGGMP